MIRYTITGGPAGDVAYRVVIAGASVRVEEGSGAAADATVALPFGVALAIEAGDTTPYAAMRDGLVKVSGRPGTLVDHQRTLARLAGQRH